MTDSPTPEATPQSVWNVFSSGCRLPAPAEIGSLLGRLYFGIAICWCAGISKFPVEAWFRDQVADLGFPAPTFFAWAAALAEVAGGVLLALGLCTRFAGFFLACTMGVAAFVFHKIPLSSVYTTQHITLLYFWAFVYYALAGAGRLSLDGLLRSRGRLAGALGGGLTLLIAIACALRTAEPPVVTPPASIEAVALVGTFNAWSLEDDPMTESEPGVWEATLRVDAPAAIEFKFVGNGDWDQAAGEQDQTDARFPVSGVAEPGADAANIAAYLPAAGEYRFRLSLPERAYEVTGAEPESEQPPRGASASP